MMATRELPSRHELVEFSHAVAGHAGTMSDADGELFIKPCTQREIDFYESATSRRHSDFKSIMPHYLGTLALSDTAELSPIDEGVSVTGSGSDNGSDQEAAAKRQKVAAPVEAAAGENVVWRPNKSKKIETDTAVVLENSTSGFKRPNILDAKLGVRLYADYAPLQKKQRFDAISENTTHKNFGFRIAGIRVWRGEEGKGEEGLDEEGYKTYDKNYGRDHVTDATLVDEIRNYVFNHGRTDMNAELGRAVCGAFVHELKRIEAVLEKNETRMYSASVLFIYEGDGEALRDAIEANNERVMALEREWENGKPVARSNARVDSGIAMADDEDEDEEAEKLPKMFDVKLIDFAHATWTPGQGPDENSLKGVKSLIRIFEELAR